MSFTPIRILLVSGLTLSLFGCSGAQVRSSGDPRLSFSGEREIRNLRKMTSGGTNAEAYWSYDGSHLSFQHSGADAPCDQIFTMRADGSELKRLSSGKGRTTCAYYLPEGNRLLYSSTHERSESCPAQPDRSQGYVWPIYDSYRIYTVNQDGTDLLPLEPASPRAYNAEATTCADGSVVFTSDRDGDLELYTGKLDAMGTLSQVKRITRQPGYDGGAVFSRDCSRIVWRASRPKPGRELEEYQRLLKQHLVKPEQMELWVANADGSHARQLTKLGGVSFAPAFLPSGHGVIFSSNFLDPAAGHQFNLFTIRLDGSGLKQVTYSGTFDSFPMFSLDGKYLAFSSNRRVKNPRETNIFIADWEEDKRAAPATETIMRNDALPADRFQAVVERLSSPDTEGRGAGTAGLKIAEDIVADQFSRIGLKPFAGLAGFRQPVQSGKFSANNIVGTLGGACGRASPVVIGAHLDHLGYGAADSLDRAPGRIHPGADDNASGVAALLEIARSMAGAGRSAASTTPAILKKSCFVFAALTGEETGVYGSSHLASELVKAQRPKAMLNLDMVGRLENNTLMTFGTESAAQWSTLAQEECLRQGLLCKGGGDGYGPSDHMPFYQKGVPVLHFFTGAHADYHRSTDTADKINATGGVQVASLVTAIALRSASSRQRLDYRKASHAPVMGAITPKIGERHGIGAYLGTIPDYSTLSSPSGPGGAGAENGGVPLAGARPGSPAEQAGVKEGDVLVWITDEAKLRHSIQTLQEFTEVLRTLKPGQKVTLGVRRGPSTLALGATVGNRD